MPRSRNDSLVVLAVVVALAGLLGGCGGGSGQSGAGAASAGTVIPLSSTMRYLKTGDQWVYVVTGQIAQAGVSPTPVTGTLTREVTRQEINGQMFTVVVETLSVSAAQGQPTQSVYWTYIDQDVANRSSRYVADRLDSGLLRIVTDNTLPLVWPGAWASNTSLAYTVHFNINSSSTNAFRVTGTENAQTPIATFAAWKVEEQRNDTNVGSSTATEWWAPQIGAPVAATATLPLSGGRSLGYSSMLVSTTVPIR